MSSYDPKDPDMQYLAVDRKKLLKEQTGTFDAKKACWAPDEQDGFKSAEIQETSGDKVTVKILDTNEVKTFKTDDVQSMNPPKFEKYEDIANLTYLNEASVLHNLRARYTSGLIYTYSGLFCIAINPYRRLPIYLQSIVDKYRGKRKTEMPPHLFSISDNAYQFMVQDRENQSMLITGESGAGKTENTKKVIAYFALVAAGEKKDKDEVEEKKGSLEDQIVQANPVLEAYGNAKTSRNNNSSRFGKFVRIHFASSGKIAGADIETYLLEKSRVTFQQSVERNYHIFYQMLSKAVPEVIDTILASPDAGLYSFINQGVLTVQGIDDVEEMNTTHAAFDVLGFTEDEKTSCYKCTGSILHMGEMKFKQKGEQAEPDGTAEAERVAMLLGVNANDFLKALCKPKIKVAMDYVIQGRTKQQVVYSVAAMAKSLFDRVFNWLVKRVNHSLDTKKPRQFFIGVLDIAGFEIFEFNSFEQLCINYTNERLQQFFNHHMFVLEQEEYKKEGIKWDFINFGMDLQACIDLIEKPLGLLSILEEECMFPKASDKTFKDKLVENHMGKSPNFLKPSKSMKGGQHGDFALKHYAGTVPYNIGGWLEKNKDPINETIVELLKQSKEHLVAMLFSPPEGEDAAAGGGGGKKKKKSSAFQTISAVHRESLNKLMKNLYTTHPHFVRCIIPNETKSPGVIDAGLVLHQLQCNGVLEGIRICRKGFPSRVVYSEFKQRYSILAPNAIPEGFVEGKVASGKILEALELNTEEYRLGNTKVFFKAGVLGYLEEVRDERLSVVVALFQAHVRGYLKRKFIKWLQDRRTALELIQKNIRKWLAMRNWLWWRFYTKVKPLLSIAAAEDEMKLKEEALAKAKEELEKVNSRCKELEEANVTLMEAKNNLFLDVQTKQDTIDDCEERIEQLLKEKADNQSQIKELNARVTEEEANNARLTEKQRQLEGKITEKDKKISQLDTNLSKSQAETKTRESTIKTLQDDMAKQDEAIAKLTKGKKDLEDQLKNTSGELQAEQDKNSQLNKLKQKLESNVDELDAQLEREKRVRGDLDKVKRKVEQDLKQSQDVSSELERVKKDLEDSIKKKEKELSSLNNGLEESENRGNQLNRKIKELQVSLDESQSETELERLNRSKVEKQRAELGKDVEELSQQLEESGSSNAVQAELAKRLQNEMARMKKEMDDNIMQAEAQVSSMRKKNQDAVNELSDQIDGLQKHKVRLEKEKSQMKSELDDLQSELESARRNKGSMSDAVAKQMQNQVADLTNQLDDAVRNVSDLSNVKNRLQNEITDLNRQVEDGDRRAQNLSREKTSLMNQLEETRRSGEDEQRIRSKLQAELRNLNAEMASLRDQLTEEQEVAAGLERQLSKANTETLQWRNKYETEGSAKVEELEDIRRRLQARLTDADQTLDSERLRTANAEKTKNRMQNELEDLTVELQRANVAVSNLEKRQRNYDKVVQEYQSKLSDSKSELDIAQKESRGYSSELYRQRSKVDDLESQLEGFRRENKNLADEVICLSSQLNEGGRSVADVEKAKRRLMSDKQDLEAALVEAEAALEQEEAKVVRAQQEVTQAKAEIEKRLAEKDEEFEATRRNFQRSLESVQATLEAESRGKIEAFRIRKKLEGEISELEVVVANASRARTEAENVAKRYQVQVKDLQTQIDDNSRNLKESRDSYSTLDRHCAVIKSENEELRTSLESTDRGRKSAEGELIEAQERVNELTAQVSSINAQKRKQEVDIAAMQTDLDDVTAELRTAQDNYKRAVADAARVADELHAEQEHSGIIDRAKKSLENQVRELQAKVDGSETLRMKTEGYHIQKLENRVRDLESELATEQQRHAETTKNSRHVERRLKEVAFQIDEEHKNQERLQEIVDKQTAKLRSFKTQIEEAEEIAAVNMMKYRKALQEAEDSESRANIAEGNLERLRVRGRASTSTHHFE